jgi:hypothetical protein
MGRPKKGSALDSWFAFWGFLTEKDPESGLVISVQVIHVTPMWNPGPEKDFNSPERIRKILEDGGTRLLADAVEKELKLQELKGRTGLGYYFSLTDKAPSIKAGEFKYMTQGGKDAKDSVEVPIARGIMANAIQK